MLKIIQKRKIWYALSSILFTGSVVIFFGFPLQYSIDFTGGSLMEVQFQNTRPAKDDLLSTLESVGLKAVTIGEAQDLNDVIRMEQIDDAKRTEVVAKLQETYPGVTEQRFESIGPTIGDELRRKAILSIVLVVVGIILYIAYSFRKISRPVQSWKYGIVAIVALIHDIAILSGLYVLIGKYMNYEIDTLFVSALLTILGYSIIDTIVTFDRIRDNLSRSRMGDFEDLVNRSLNQVLTRSLNTSTATLIMLLALFLFGGDTIKPFALALFVGVVVGTYSSIFLASPLLVTWQLIGNKRK